MGCSKEVPRYTQQSDRIAMRMQVFGSQMCGPAMFHGTVPFFQHEKGSHSVLCSTIFDYFLVGETRNIV